ncbi:MAG: sensor histidine kinase [Solirubrobacterales bacterium]|nr:sensor histidine kinase [Solirubrobacterales bacterium]
MRSRTLVTQVLVANLLLIIAAVIGAVLATDPRIDLSETPDKALVLGLAVALTIGVNVIILQRRFRPLERLVDDMERADLSRPGASQRAASEDYGGPEEVSRLQMAFRRMLERLEAERMRVSSAALRAQEEERARVARDLHDEVNQSLTGLLLRLEATRKSAPAELAAELAETQALANQAMQELLGMSRQLRPTALDDLGLKAAVAGLVKDLEKRGELRASLRTEGELTGLPEDVQLVVYRVTQEALNNTARHADAGAVEVLLRRAPRTLELVVRDDGRGFAFEEGGRGLGLGGMRERALLVGGDLEIESRADLGTRISLRIELGESGDAGPAPGPTGPARVASTPEMLE